MDEFSLCVDTVQMTRALNRLRRVERRAKFLCLRFHSQQLTISMGKTSEALKANGSWPEPVSVVRRWAETVGHDPPEAAVTHLRVANGKLWARDFGAGCAVGVDRSDDEGAATKCRDTAGAKEALARYSVTDQELDELVEHADPDKASLWGANDDQLVGDVALAWRHLVLYGVEPSEIRKLLNQKLRALWKNSPKRRPPRGKVRSGNL